MLLLVVFFLPNNITAQEVTITPEIIITHPAENQSFTNQSEIPLEVKIVGGETEKVIFKIYRENQELENLPANVGGQDIWNKVLDVTNYNPGEYFLEAQADLKNGQKISSSNIKFEIVTKQELIINWINYQKILNGGQTFQINANIKPDYLVLFLENDLVKKNLGFAEYNQESGLWELTYDTKEMEDGAYVLTAEGYSKNNYHQIKFDVVVNNNSQDIPLEELPNECIISGITNKKACQRLLFTTNSVDCGQDRTDESSCREVDSLANFPDDCRWQNISDVKECQKLLILLYAPAECQNVNDWVTCQNLLATKYVDPKCQEKSITEKKACEDYLIKNYQKTFSCPHLDQTTCHRVVRERHLPFLISAIDRLDGMEDDLKDFSTVTNSRVRITPSFIKVLLSADDQIVYSPPMALLLDSDGDGLPDSTEIRLGTEPKRYDSDRDGFNDFQEIQSDLENLKKVGIMMSNLDKVIFNEQKLEQPITFGYSSSLVAVEKIENKNSSLVFSGKSFPDSFVTIFIYSDIPVVTDVKADANGNFDVAIQNILPDGYHQVYAAITNDQGQILTKSDRYDFFVKNGRVATAKSLMTTNSASKNYNQITYIIFLIIVSGLVFITAKKFRKR